MPTSSTNPWEEIITWQPAQPVEPDEPWLVCLDDGTVGQAFMEGIDWYWSDDIGLNYPITARVARMARLPIGPPLPFQSLTGQPLDAADCSPPNSETWECRACGNDFPCRVLVKYRPTKYADIEAQSRFLYRKTCICGEPKHAEFVEVENAKMMGGE